MRGKAIRTVAGLPPLVLFTGGVRSGKSALAQEWTERWARTAGTAFFVATCRPCDAETRARVAAHQARRGACWQVLEEALDPATALARHWHGAGGGCDAGVGDSASRAAALPGSSAPVLLDCVSMWLSNLLAEGLDDAAVAARVDGLAAVLARRRGPAAVVSAETGLGLTPLTALGRRFVDLLGLANQRLAREAQHVVLVACGLPLALKGGLPPEPPDLSGVRGLSVSPDPSEPEHG